jgi:aldose 1-epimerase
MAAIREFGRIGDAVVEEVTLTAASGARAAILTWGATLRDLVVPMASGEPRRVVLGWNRAEDCAADAAYLGVVAGRVANRIGGGGFTLDGRRWPLPANEGPSTMLHGGPVGFSRRNWSIAAASDDEVTLVLVSAAGDQGFPGRVEMRCRYRLTETATLDVEIEATTDAPTPVNPTHHAYFTLDQGGDCRQTRLRIAASHVTPVDAAMIPTGEIAAVAGTRFDFRRLRPIGEDYDVNFALDGPPGEAILAAEAIGPDGRLRLEVETDRPGLQLYTAPWLAPAPAEAGGPRIGPHAGFCLEAQGFPDAPNRRQFPSVTLRPGETFRTRTRFRFLEV